MGAWTQGVTTVLQCQRLWLAKAVNSTWHCVNRQCVCQLTRLCVPQLALRSLVLAMGDRLLSLNLSGSTITKSALAYASVRFYSLANLNLSGCAEVSNTCDAGGALNCAAHPACCTPQLKDDSAAAIIAGCRATLTSLNVSHCPLLTHEALRWLAGIVGHPPAPCRKLQSLNASHCPLIRDEGLAALGKGTPLLDFVSFAHCDKVVMMNGAECRVCACVG